MDGGVSISDADLVATILDADFVLGGRVLYYQDYDGPEANPRVEFSTVLIERRSRKVVWSSHSYNDGTRRRPLLRARTSNDRPRHGHPDGQARDRDDCRRRSDRRRRCSAREKDSMTYRLRLATASLLVSCGRRRSAVVAAAGAPGEGRPAGRGHGQRRARSPSTSSSCSSIRRSTRNRLLEGVGTRDGLELLDRLITIRLIAQEAATMGLGDLPEIRKQVDVTSRADPARRAHRAASSRTSSPTRRPSSSAFKELVREWKTDVAALHRRGAAKARARGASPRARTTPTSPRGPSPTKKAKVRGRRRVPPAEGLPARDCRGTRHAGRRAGQPGHPHPGRVRRREGRRRPVSRRTPDARAEARRTSSASGSRRRLKAHEDALRAEHVVVNKDVLDGLDYAGQGARHRRAAEGHARRRGDQGREPGDGRRPDRLPAHAVLPRRRPGRAGQAPERPEGGRARRHASAGALLNVEAAAARARQVARRTSTRVNAFEDSLVFDTFVQKVIVPDSKLKEEDVKAYYDAHLKDYS